MHVGDFATAVGNKSLILGLASGVSVLTHVPKFGNFLPRLRERSQPALAFVKDRILRHNILNLEGKSR
jgi:hypothetical protein